MKQWTYDHHTGILLNPPKWPEVGSSATYMVENNTWTLQAWALYPDGSSASILRVVVGESDRTREGYEEEAARLGGRLRQLWELV